MPAKLVFVSLALLVCPAITRAQTSAPPPDMSTDSLRFALYALAADSMGGRQTGELGDWKAQEWVAAQLRRLGLRPAGDQGTFFQVIPFRRIAADTVSRIGVPGGEFFLGQDFLPLGSPVSLAL